MFVVSNVKETYNTLNALQNVGLILTDADGRIIDANSNFLSFSGYTLAELKGKKIGKSTGILYSGIHDDSFYKQMWQGLMEAKTFFSSVVNRNKAGSLYTQDIDILPILENENSTVPVLFLGVVRNTTDYSKSKKDAKKYKNYFEAMLMTIPNGCLVLSVKDKYLYEYAFSNKYFDETFKFSAKEGSILNEYFIDKELCKKLNVIYESGGSDIIKVYDGNLRKHFSISVAKFNSSHIAMFFTDITEAREKALKLTEYISLSEDAHVILNSKEHNYAVYEIEPSDVVSRQFPELLDIKGVELAKVSFMDDKALKEIIPILEEIDADPTKVIRTEKIIDICGVVIEIIFKRFNSNKFYVNIRNITASRKEAEKAYALDVLKEQTDRLIKSQSI